MMLYEKIRHISSAATEINNLMRAVSADGVSFANSPETSPIPGGSTIASNFDPSLVRVQDATVRLYYSASAKVYSALSTDDGESWTEEGRVPILGRSTSFAPFPIEASVVKDPSGNFLMFFASPLDSETSSYSIFLAKSDDGTNFHVFDEALLIPPEGSSYRDPNAIQLQNGSIRLYFVERTGDLNSQTRATKSGIVQ